LTVHRQALSLGGSLR